MAADIQASLQAAMSHHQAGRLREAEALYRDVLLRQPDHAIALYYFGMLQHQAGNLVDAAALVGRSVEIDPSHAARFSDLGIVNLALGRTADAIAAFTATLKLAPDNFEVQAQLGDLLARSGDTNAAIACYERAVKLRPAMAEAHNNLGNLYCAAGRIEDAVRECRVALQLEPSLAEAHNNLGNALKSLGLSSEAMGAYEAALRLRPGFAEAHNNLGLLLADLGKWAAAAACFRNAVAARPDFAEAYAHLADMALQEGRVDEAAAHCGDAIRHRPGDVVAHWTLGNVRWTQGRHAEAAEAYAAALRLDPQSPAIASNLLYARLYDPALSPQALLQAHRAYAAQFETPLKSAWSAHPNDRDPERRLKIGYVSADFRSHPVAHFIAPVFAHHDKERFEIHAYYNHERRDEFTERLSSHCDRWTACAKLTDNQLADRIRADGIDILVDLSGHTAGNRLPVFARKPAPVQITYLSYPGTTGLDAVDYRLTDRHAEPEGSSAHYSETLLPLPHSLTCFVPAPYMPAVTSLPAAANGFVTFGSFNNFNKVNDGCIELWARILRAVPTAKLLMVTVPPGEARERFLEHFERLGIPRARIECHGKLPGPEFVKAIARADIALDPFPMTGGTTTMETLWMGVPTIVLVGQRFISRVGFSFLISAGLPEFAASDEDTYVRIATELAGDMNRLAGYRGALRATLAGSPLLDAAGFTRDLESCYRDIWRRRCGSMDATGKTR